MKLVPISGSPPIPMHVVCPRPSLCELMDGLVGQRSALRHDTDTAFLADVAGNDARLRLAGRDQPRTVRSDEPRLRASHDRQRPHHVERRDALGDAHGQRQAGIGGFHDRVGGKGRRHENHRRVGAGLAHRVSDGVEHRPAFMRRPALAGRHAADDLGAVGGRLLGVEGPFAACEALHDAAGYLLIDEIQP